MRLMEVGITMDICRIIPSFEDAKGLLGINSQWLHQLSPTLEIQMSGDFIKQLTKFLGTLFRQFWGNPTFLFPPLYKMGHFPSCTGL